MIPTLKSDFKKLSQVKYEKCMHDMCHMVKWLLNDNRITWWTWEQERVSDVHIGDSDRQCSAGYCHFDVPRCLFFCVTMKCNV